MCAARGRRHAGVLACVAGRSAGAEVQGLIRRAVLGGQCVPSRGVCQPMRELPHFRSSVVCAARLTRRPKEGGCWPLGWILSTFSSRAAAVRARLARAVCLWAVGGERQRRGEAARTATDGEPGWAQGLELSSARICPELRPPVIRLRPRDGPALLDMAPPCSAVVCKLSSGCPLLSSLVYVLSSRPLRHLAPLPLYTPSRAPPGLISC